MLTGISKREEVIERWMLTIIDDGGIDRLDDLHIDKIDLRWKNRDCWVEGGLEALRLAIVIRNRNQLPFAVALAFSLRSDNRPLGVDFRTRTELDERLNWSPPSLYLFRRGEEPRTRVANGDAAQDLTPSIFGTLEAGLSCYFWEFLPQGAEEYCRSVSLEG